MTMHDSMCDKKLIKCPNEGCSMMLERGRKRKHVDDDCEYSYVVCKYADLGCRKKRIRKDIKMHEDLNDNQHFHLALEKTMESSRIILEQRRNTMTFCMAEYSLKRETNEVFLSDVFYTSRSGYKMRVEIYPNGRSRCKNTHLSAFIRLLKGQYDDSLDWPFKGTVTLELLNQSEDTHHLKRGLNWDDGSVDSINGFHKFVKQLTFTGCDGAKNYLVRDRLYFRVKVMVADYKPWLECTCSNQ